MDEYSENYMESLREELLEMVEKHLTPAAIKYGYSEMPLETNIKWRPLVLVIGNYSSGKSAMINEFLGAEVQATGQAPTDDSFTVITGKEPYDSDIPIKIFEEKDGKYLLNDPEFPFESMKKHGQRFVSHFRLKIVNSPFLNSLAIIDTPGMLDSISEKDRGYDYQDVIGDLAHIADLIIVLFDPHKAGTVREAHTSLRDILPGRTFEDRIIFVLNRIDECSSFKDLIRVYGTLCWNLSQITGRKDIPMILLTYSNKVFKSKDRKRADFLKYLKNQRQILKEEVLATPRRRLDNLASFIETHGERLTHFLEALVNFRSLFLKFKYRFYIMGLIISLIIAGFGVLSAIPYVSAARFITLLIPISVFIFLLWFLIGSKIAIPGFIRKKLADIDSITQLNSRSRQDSWEAVKNAALAYIEKSKGNFSYWDVKSDYLHVKEVFEKGSKEVRSALKELQDIEIRDESDSVL